MGNSGARSAGPQAARYRVQDCRGCLGQIGLNVVPVARHLVFGQQVLGLFAHGDSVGSGSGTIKTGNRCENCSQVSPTAVPHRRACCPAKCSGGGELEQFRAFGDLVTRGVEQFGHRAIGGAAMVCSIFMASITASAWPLLHGITGLDGNDTTLPGMGVRSGGRLPDAHHRVGQRIDCYDL